MNAAMTKVRLPKSIKKYIRKEKARIRREIFDPQKQQQKIEELLKRFYEKELKEKVGSRV